MRLFASTLSLVVLCACSTNLTVKPDDGAPTAAGPATPALPPTPGATTSGGSITPIEPIDPAPVCVADAGPELALCLPGVAAVAGFSPFPSIQAAIAASPTVAVCPGTHHESLVASGPLTLRSASGDPADTVLSGDGVRRILTASGGLTVSGLGFVDGFDGYSGGAVEAAGDVTVACSVFRDSYADYGGGAIQARGDLHITGSSFEGNSAGYEGGAVSWGDWTDGELTVEDSTFVGNHADYSGGAIQIGTWANADVIAITGSRFEGNTDGYDDGVVSFGSWGGFTGTIDGCHFEGNDVAIGTNGWLLDGYTLDVTGTTFVGAPGAW